MSENPIAVNLKRLRSIKGFNQSQVAESAGLSRIAYSNIESGKAEPRVSNLQKIGKVLGVGIQDLLAPLPQLTTLRFRSRKTLTVREKNKRKQIAFDVAFWLKDFNELEENLSDKKEYKLKDLSQKTKSPKKMAEMARMALGLEPDDAINDICGLLESKAGIKIKFFVSDLDKCNGLSLFDDQGAPGIGVNISDNISVERQMFTLAHELAHLLLHKNSYKNEEDAENKDQEKQANEFASYFLMPREAFLKSWEENKGLRWIQNVLHTKRIYKVSYRTILQRFIDEGWISDKKYLYQKFNIDYQKFYSRDLKNHREPNPLDRIDFLEDRLSLLVRNAFEREQISFSRAAEVLKINTEDMRDRVNSWEMVK